MKRIFAILLALTLLLASGCGSTSGNNEQPDNNAADNIQNSDVIENVPTEDESNENTDEVPDEEKEPEVDLSNSDYHPTVTGCKLGDTIADFTITTYNGMTVTLSEVLAEKDAVLINIFATWCGPCKTEFPFMESAYKQLKDKVEVIALSGDSSDTSEKIRNLATSLGLTFPVGADSASIMRSFKINAYPTSILIDRFGTIVFIHVGSLPDEQAFLSLFEFLISEEYTESVVLDSIPPVMPHLDKLSSEELGNALDANGIVFENTPGQYNWPMSVAEIDGRNVLVSSNQGMDRSSSAVQTTVNAKAGDVFAFDLKISSEAAFDFFTLTVNNEIVKVFSGEKDWSSFAYQFPSDGEYSIKLAYVKDDYTGSGEDTLWLDNVRILSGDDAAAALAANPSYPLSAETTFEIENKNVTEIVFEDPYKIAYKIFGCPYRAYLINELEAKCVFTLAEGVDPEAAICYDNNDLRYTLASILSDDGYFVNFTIDSMGTTGKGYTYVILDPNVNVEGDEYPILFFADQEGIEKFAKTFAAGAWYDAEEWEKNHQDENNEPLGDVTYTIRCVDENGERVPGVTLQICNDSTCSVYVSDANGECVLTLPSDNYEIHILKAPDGFTFDSEAVIEAPVEGGEITISLKHA